MEEKKISREISDAMYIASEYLPRYFAKASSEGDGELSVMRVPRAAVELIHERVSSTRGRRWLACLSEEAFWALESAQKGNIISALWFAGRVRGIHNSLSPREREEGKKVGAQLTAVYPF